MDQRAYWNEFYGQNLITGPSDFAKWVSLQPYLKNLHLIDWGCGSGRDGLFLTNIMKKVTLVDNSDSAIRRVKQRIEQEQILNAEVLVSDVGKDSKIEINSDVGIIHYARFFLHAIDDNKLSTYINSVSLIGKEQSSRFATFEYRVEDLDENLEYTFGNHRRWLRNKDVVSEIMSNLGWALKVEEVSRDFAIFQKEKPLVARQVFIQ